MLVNEMMVAAAIAGVVIVVAAVELGERVDAYLYKREVRKYRETHMSSLWMVNRLPNYL